MKHTVLGLVRSRRFLRWVVLPHLGFLAVAWWTDAPDLIALLNPIVVSLSVAVCIAFLPALLLGLYDDEPVDPAGLMVAGVFLGWYGNALRSTWSTVWRALGMPEWFANTDITSYILFSLGWGATFHLIAPGAVGGRAPGARWIKAGLWAGAGVFVALSLSHRGDIAALVQWLRPAHDGVAGPP